MEFRIYKSTGQDADIWKSLIMRLKPEQRDIHFIPEYGLIYKQTYGYEPYLAFYGDEKEFVIQPFIVRLLNTLPFLKDQGIKENYYDITNAYGYGGPICHCDSENSAKKFYQEFDSHFKEYCIKNRIASEFTSLHPLLRNHELLINSGIITIQKQKDIVYIDLSLEKEDIWKGIRKGHKSSIKKANSKNVEVIKAVPDKNNFETLNLLYYKTMERNKAKERWFFPENYFSNCYSFLGNNRVTLYFAFINGEPATASILMHDFNTIYYHFAGSDEKYYDYCPNNLLLYEVSIKSKENGFLNFHLGGGVSSNINDNLFIFKSGFSNLTASLYTYYRIHNKEIYEILCNLKKKHEIAILGNEIESDFFPLYRR